MKNKYIAPFFIFLFQLFWVIKLNYPPSFEQLALPLSTPFHLWALRLICLLLILFSFHILAKNLKDPDKNWFWVIIALSPVSTLLVMSYPISVLKLFIISVIIEKFANRKTNVAVPIILTTAILLLVNIVLLKQSPAILSKLSSQAVQAELTDRFNKEHLLQPGNFVPLVIKRIAYNKYFLLAKNISDELFHFADLETLFFQEIHPNNQKSVPIFFWAELGLFVMALWVYTNRKIALARNETILIFASLIFFTLSSDIIMIRHLITLVLIATLISRSIPALLSLNKATCGIVIALFSLSLYGGLAFFVDIQKRPSYWLDNKPLVYKTYFETHPLNSYDHIYMADLFGFGEEYCRFYRKDCGKFTFSNFQMSELITKPNEIYIGFSGNFFGSGTDRNFDKLDENYLSEQKIEFIDSESIRDNVANGYGQNIIFAVRKQKNENK